jgi:hypothetical protein
VHNRRVSVKHPAPDSPDITARSVAWLLALLV